MIQKEVEALHTEKTCLFKWLEQAKTAAALNIDDIQFAHDQIHNLIKGSCFWPQLMHLNEPLNDAEQQFLCEQTVSIFLSRYLNQQTK